MAKLLELKTFTAETGNLTVFEKHIPGSIKRVFYIYGAGEASRAGHRHHRTWHALICLNGSCRVYNHNGESEETYWLTNPQQCLILEPRDWHIMSDFTENAILLVLSNEIYDKADYIYEPYPDVRQLSPLHDSVS